MNKHDQDNVNFIMSLDDEQFEIWADSATEDDIQYALEILQAARVERMFQEQDLLEELLDRIVEADLSEARAVLQKFML